MLNRRDILKRGTAITSGLAVTSGLASANTSSSKINGSGCSEILLNNEGRKYILNACGDTEILVKVDKNSNAVEIIAHGQEALQLADEIRDSEAWIEPASVSDKADIVIDEYDLRFEKITDACPAARTDSVDDYYLAADYKLTEAASYYGGTVLSAILCYPFSSLPGSVICALANAVISREVYDGQYEFTMGLLDVHEYDYYRPPNSIMSVPFTKPQVACVYAPYRGASAREAWAFSAMLEPVRQALIPYQRKVDYIHLEPAESVIEQYAND